MIDFYLGNEEGGYTYASVDKKVEAYKMLLSFAQDPYASAEKMMPLIEKLRNLPLKRVKGGFFSKCGYSIEDTERLLAELDAEIMTALEYK